MRADWESAKIAAMAEPVICRSRFTSGPIANAATPNWPPAPNFYLLETMATDIPWRKHLTSESLVFRTATSEIPDRPGLGIELNERVLPTIYQPVPRLPRDLTDIRPPEAEPYFDTPGTVRA